MVAAVSDATPIRVGRDANGRFVKLPPVEQADVRVMDEVHAPLHAYRFVHEPLAWQPWHVVALPAVFVAAFAAAVFLTWWFT